MLLRPHDAPREGEWQTYLEAHHFGQLVAGGDGSRAPAIIPIHFSYDGDRTIACHLAIDNPIWPYLEESPLAVMAVVDDYAFIPSYWNEPSPHGVGTSFYAAVQAIGEVEVIDEPGRLADLIRGQLRDMQPEGGQDPLLDHEDPKYLTMLGRIRGMLLTIQDVRAKFKFGGSKPKSRRLEVAEHLLKRGHPQDLKARQQILDHL